MKSILFPVLAALLVWAAMPSLGDEEMQPGQGIVRQIQGSARYRAADGDWKPLKKGVKVGPRTTLRTEPESTVDISLGVNGAILRVTPGTTVKFEKLGFRGSGGPVVIETKLELVEGRILGAVRNVERESTYEIKTPTGVAGLRGVETAYDISTAKNSAGKYETIYICLKGLVVGGNVWAGGSNTFALDPGEGSDGNETKPAKRFDLPSIALPKTSLWNTPP